MGQARKWVIAITVEYFEFRVTVTDGWQRTAKSYFVRAIIHVCGQERVTRLNVEIHCQTLTQPLDKWHPTRKESSCQERTWASGQNKRFHYVESFFLFSFFKCTHWVTFFCFILFYFFKFSSVILIKNLSHLYDKYQYYLSQMSSTVCDLDVTLIYYCWTLAILTELTFEKTNCTK